MSQVIVSAPEVMTADTALVDGWTVRNQHGDLWAYFAWGGICLFGTSVRRFSNKQEARKALDEMDEEAQVVSEEALISTAIARGLLPEDTPLPLRVVS